MVKVSSLADSVLGSGVVEVVVEVLEDGFRMFLNLDLRLKERGLVVAGLLEVVGWVVALSLEELSSRVLDLNKEETGFREKDLVVGLGEVVVGGEDSSEVGFLSKFRIKVQYFLQVVIIVC